METLMVLLVCNGFYWIQWIQWDLKSYWNYVQNIPQKRNIVMILIEKAIGLQCYSNRKHYYICDGFYPAEKTLETIKYVIVVLMVLK